MDREYLILLMEKAEFPCEAKECILNAFDIVKEKSEKEILAILDEYKALEYVTKDLVDPVREIAEKADISEHTLWMILVILASGRAKDSFVEKVKDEQIFWDTFTDLRYKLLECKQVKGVWGTFVPHWYRKFFVADIIKLGRLEYENRVFPFVTPYVFGDIVLEGDVEVKSIHIPSAPEKFDYETRLDSYKKAYKFFAGKEKGEPMIFFCYSWLLYTPYKEILSPNSNIVSFMNDFDVYRLQEDEAFNDGWRIFGADMTKEPKDLLEETSLQRAFKKYLMEDKKTGHGFGIIVFDGEKILNNK